MALPQSRDATKAIAGGGRTHVPTPCSSYWRLAEPTARRFSDLHVTGSPVVKRDTFQTLCYYAIMTNFEKFLLGLLLLYAAAHIAVKYGRAAGLSAGAISLAENLATGF